LKKPSRSALMVSASVVGIPVREALVGLQRRVLQQLGRERTGVGVGDDLVVVAMHHQRGDGDLLEVFG
jgi:hypothetical protein